MEQSRVLRWLGYLAVEISRLGRFAVGFYIKIEKIFEDDSIANYKFSPDGKRFGIIEVKKSDGVLTLIEPMEGDNHDIIVMRAAARLRQVCVDGAYPETAAWVS